MFPNRKKIFFWSLYDFANSVAIGVFFLYFSQWLLVDKGILDIWYNLIFVASTLLLILTVPIFGVMADKIGVRMPFLRAATWGMFLALLIGSLAATVSFGSTFIAALAYMVANYFYQFSFTFYNPMIEELAPQDKRGKISGIGQSANWLGQITGLVITLPFATGAITLFGDPSRAQSFLPASVLFMLLALPMLYFFKEIGSRRQVVFSLRKEYQSFLQLLRI